jgi:hypothetical protein
MMLMPEDRMRRFINLLQVLFVASASLAASTVSRAATPLLPVCSWPFEATGSGITNVGTPDTNATYWVMPLDTGRWKAMTIHGTYPRARFFNFTTYTSKGSVISTVYDADISPDSGSTNPFATQNATGASQYTVTVGESTGGANTLQVAGSRLVFVVFRLYVPDMGLDRTGGVGLPSVTLTGFNGSTKSLQPCPFASAETSLGSMIILLGTSGFADAASFLQTFLEAANQRGLVTGICNPATPSPTPVLFAPSTLNPNFFPDPPTTYLETQGFCYQANKIVVIRGKAPVFPNTYNGGSIFEPAFDEQIQLRYWSMCNNDRVVPYPVLGCSADFATQLDSNQEYTYVVSADPAPPSWLPKTATWLPWGDTTIPKNLIFRSTLPVNFQPAGDYMPMGVFCDETTFIDQGWQACFSAAGIAVPTD